MIGARGGVTGFSQDSRGFIIEMTNRILTAENYNWSATYTGGQLGERLAWSWERGAFVRVCISDSVNVVDVICTRM